MPKAYKQSPFTPSYEPPRVGPVADAGLDEAYGEIAGRLERFSRQRMADVSAAKQQEAQHEALEADPTSLESMRSDMSASGRAYNQALINRYLDDGLKSIATKADEIAQKHRGQPDAFLEEYRSYAESMVSGADPLAREAFGRYAFHLGQRQANVLTEQAQRIADEENKAAILGQIETSITDLSNSAFAVGKGGATPEAVADLTAKAEYWIRQGFEDAEVPLLSAEAAANLRERVKWVTNSSLLLGEYSKLKGTGSQEAFITRFNDGGHPLSSKFSVEERRQLSRSMMVEVREAKAEARQAEAIARAEAAYQDHANGQALALFDARVNAGFPPTKDEYERTRKQFLEVGDVEKMHELDGSWRFAQETRGLATMALDDIASFIEKRGPEIASTGDAGRVEALKEIYQTQARARAADPYGTAQRVGLVPAESVDLTDPQSVAQREVYRQRVEAAWKQPVSLLSKAEADGFSHHLSKLDVEDQAVALESVSRALAPNSLGRAELAEQLYASGQKLPATAMRVADQLLQGAGPEVDPGLVVRKVLAGPQYAKQLPESVKGRDKVINAVAGIVGNAFANAPDAGASAMDAIYNVYLADTYAAGDFQEGLVDPERVEGAVRQVLGSTPGKVKIGTVTSSVIPPRGWSADEITEGFARLRPEDFVDQGGIATRGVEAPEVEAAATFDAIRRGAQLIQVASDRWQIGVAGADGRPYVLANPDGKALEVTAGMLQKASFRHRARAREPIDFVPPHVGGKLR